MGSVARAIAAANNGLLFDIGDMSTLYQDAAGTTPVTAVEQPVGKILDKSGNGNHATRSVTASRPVLSARYNLLSKTEDFNASEWALNGISPFGAGSVVNAGISPDGTQSADLIVESTNSGTHYIWSTTRTITVGDMFCGEIKLKPAGRSRVRIQLDGSSGNLGAPSVIDIQNCTVAVIGSGVSSVSAEAVNNGFCLVKISAKSTGASQRFTVFLDNGITNSYAGDGVSGVYIWGADFRPGTSFGPYQRVNTATDYDTDPRYFPAYLRFDGVDDYLNLPYMGLYAGGEMSIIAARNAVSQSTDTYIISERSTTDADPKYFPSRQLASGGNMDAYISDDAAAVVLDTVGSAFGGAADKVIRSVVDTGSNLKLYKNGSLAADDNYTRAGTLTLNNTTLGASVSTTTGNYAAMKLYGLIITKSALTDAQRVRCERFLARKAGVAL